jgi:hypothetical protein
LTTEYDKPVRKYRGKGVVKFSDNTRLSCQVHIVQVDNGSILIKCLFIPKNARALPFSKDLQIESLNGHIDGGLRFKTQGRLFLSRVTTRATGYRTITLIGQEVVFKAKTVVNSNSLFKFSLVNFEFLGNEPAVRHLKRGSQTVEEHYLSLKLVLPWGEVSIHPVSNSTQILNRIKAQKGIAVTSEALVSMLPRSNFPDTVAKLDELCRLLSLSRGTKINWVNAESFDSSGNLTPAVLKNSITWPFSSLTLIDYRNPHDTPTFIEKIYSAYLKHRDSYNLDIAIEQYLDAKRETAYLETRGLAAAALIDSLQQLYFSEKENGFIEIIKDKDFAQQKHIVRNGMKKLMKSTFPNIEAEELQEVLEKIPELNRRSFLNLLKKWTSDLGLEIPAPELSAIKDTRNSLAHKMRFKSNEQTEKKREYFRLMNLIDQVFLKLLDYKGYFIYVDLKTLAFERKELV